MYSLKIQGGQKLNGRIRISGSKNATLPIMAASLLHAGKVTLTNVPDLADVRTLMALFETFGVKGTFNAGTLFLDPSYIHTTTAPYELVCKMRASILCLGPLLARFRHAEISLPGGCAIGARPVDLHLKALEAMGAKIKLEKGYIIADAPKGLQSCDFSFPFKSVGATENAMIAACLADGPVTLRNSAQEPEIVDLGRFLQTLGINISGLGSDCMTIHGSLDHNLHQDVDYTIMSDRIEAGTYVFGALMTDGEVVFDNYDITQDTILADIIRRVGGRLEGENNVAIDHGPFRVQRQERTLRPTDMVTEPYPGFPTDLQAQFMSMMTQAIGASVIKETIFENRFMHVPELCRMGADITLHGNVATVKGPLALKGAEVMATDLRASASLVLAALIANGQSYVHRIYHLERGYEHLHDKLSGCGAIIERVRMDHG